jgi:sec-independent protein translocase protein TatA
LGFVAACVIIVSIGAPLTFGGRRGGCFMEGLFQPTHLIFILIIVLILFGPGKLPELGKGLGKGIREFKDALKGGMEGNSEKKEEEKKT